MRTRNYDEANVIRVLSKKKCVRFSSVSGYKVIEVTRNTKDLGNKSWGKIDYLTNVHGYLLLFVDGLPRTPQGEDKGDDKYKANSKAAKRESKLNMAVMAKSAMKRAKAKK